MFGGGGDVIRAMASGDVQIGEAGSSPHHRRGQPGPGHQAVLDPRRHRRRRGPGRAQRLRHQQREGPEGQEGRDAVRLDRALPADGRHEARRRRPEDGQRDEHAAAGDRRRLGARRHRRRLHLGPGAVEDQGQRQGARDLGRRSARRATRPSTASSSTPSGPRRTRPSWSRFVKALAKADAEYRANAAKWTADSPQVKAVAKWTKADAEGRAGGDGALHASRRWQEQASATWLGGGAAKAMANTAVFLKEQGRVQEVKPNYSDFVTDDLRAEGDGASSATGAARGTCRPPEPPCRRSTSAT